MQRCYSVTSGPANSVAGGPRPIGDLAPSSSAGKCSTAPAPADRRSPHRPVRVNRRRSPCTRRRRTCLRAGSVSRSALKIGRVAIDIGERSLANIAGVNGQEAAGIDVPDVRDEQETLAVVDAACRPAWTCVCAHRQSVRPARTRARRLRMSAGMAVAHLSLLQIVLQQVAAVVHGFGRLDLET